MVATGHLYTVLTAGPEGVDESRWRVYSGREDDHGRALSPATTAARAMTTAGDERLVRDVVRLTVLQALKTSVEQATTVTKA